MARVGRRLALFAIVVFALLGLTAAGGGFYVQRQLQHSLPQTTGTAVIPGLEAPVTVDRDALGIPTITAGSRTDAARALGFVHAQERFFQMDLQRRQPAGELSALVGERALAVDRTARLHRFRHVSRRAVERATPEYRALLDAYADGVNAGLAALAAPPIEYHVLRATPEPWRPEDTILTVLAMFSTLQGRQAQFEMTFGTLHDTLPAPAFAFLTARGSAWDAPVAGDPFTRPPVPGPEVLDLRNQLRAIASHPRGAAATSTLAETHSTGGASDARLCAAVPRWPVCLSHDEAAGLGSNNWAVAGAHTSTGAALVANDMHLGIGVPNIWYRATVKSPDRQAPGDLLRVSGVTLPGVPGIVVGSNGHVAWGFTNTGGDWSDLIVVDPDPRDPMRYVSPTGPRPFESVEESIAVAGGTAVTVTVRWSEWGPVIGRDHRGREIVQRWIAHDPALLARDATVTERARSLDEALTAVAGLGIPNQNFVAADRSGRIGWTIAGAIPRRVGFDGSVPTSWSDGSRRWDGYLAAHEFPRVVDPPSGRLWTANSAVITTEALGTIGEGGYADGIRARIIRDRLMALDKASAADMLAVQLDSSALFHDRWRTLLLGVLTPSVTGADPRREDFRAVVERTWNGRADPESAGYRLVREFRGAVSRQVYGAVNTLVRQHDREFDFARAFRSEGPLWDLVAARPQHLLDARHDSWDALLVAAVDEAIAGLTADGATLAAQTWGAANRAVITHPLGAAIPLVGRYINMPADALPGDIYTPRAHSPRAGPSQRLVVSPGREEDGILHMPTGQSGHPLSPHYRDQHDAWLHGKPLPLLPGPPVTTLRLDKR